MLDSSTHAGAQYFCRLLQSQQSDVRDKAGLIIGYGRGHEASFLAKSLQAWLVGIDLHPPANVVWRESFTPVLANGLDLPFPGKTFDFVFYHHVIEHVQDPLASLLQIRRVLRPGGLLYIGTPNRHRIVGYLGSHQTTFRQKLLWNLTDYVGRVRGRFQNELGAHAGFSRQELGGMLQDHFSEIEWITGDYLWFKYGGHLPRVILKILTWDPVMELAAPSIYALCRK